MLPLSLLTHPCQPRPPDPNPGLHILRYAKAASIPPKLALCCSLFPFAVRLCIAQIMPLDFVSKESPRCHLVSYVSGVEDSLRCPSFVLPITCCTSLPSITLVHPLHLVFVLIDLFLKPHLFATSMAVHHPTVVLYCDQ